jgi:hypothetical protein
MSHTVQLIIENLEPQTLVLHCPCCLETFRLEIKGPPQGVPKEMLLSSYEYTGSYSTSSKVLRKNK